MTGPSPADARRGPAAPGGLLRILGVGFGLAVIVGSTLGIGILRTPGLVAAQLSRPRASSRCGSWVASIRCSVACA